jgi:hypothetical protein
MRRNCPMVRSYKDDMIKIPWFCPCLLLTRSSILDD